MDIPLGRYSLKVLFCLSSILFLHLELGAVEEPDLRLVAERAGKTYPVVSFAERTPTVALPSGQTVAVDAFVLALEGTAGPSLDLGYSPAHYDVQRLEADYHRAAKGGPLHLYNLSFDSTRVKETYPVWNELALYKLWDEEELMDEASIFLLAWWQDGWKEVYQCFTHAQYVGGNIVLIQEELSGRPVLFLWRDGKWIPPELYRQNLPTKAFAEIQTGIFPHGEDPKETDALGLTWLHYATSWGLSGLNEVEDLDRFKDQPTHILNAALHGQSQTLATLLEAGFPMTAKHPDFQFDTGQLAVLGGHTEAFELLLQQGYDPTKENDTDGYSALTLAMDLGRDDITGLILETGAKPPKLPRWHRAEILSRDASKGRANALRAWADEKTLKRKTSRDLTPLSFATYSGNPEAVRVLLEAGADPNEETRFPPLLLAAGSDVTESLRLLLQAGADPNITNAAGDTALRNAVVIGNDDAVRLLLAAGADPNPPVKGSLGVAELATITGQSEVVSDLFASGTVCELEPKLAEEILIRAVSNDIVEMTILAYEKCVGPDFVLYGEYPLSWVADYYDAQAVKDWWAGQETSHPAPAPEIVGSRLLDERLKALATSFPEFGEKRFRRYGRIDVEVEVIIDEEGRIRFPRFRGNLPPELLLETYAHLNAWRFSPPMLGAKPVKTQAIIPLIFQRPIEEGQIYEVTSIGTRPEPMKMSPPEYPAILRRQKISGEVILEFVVRPNGLTSAIRATRSTHPMFTQAAIEAVEKWEFTPGKRAGMPVSTRVRIPIPFYTR